MDIWILFHEGLKQLTRGERGPRLQWLLLKTWFHGSAMSC